MDIGIQGQNDSDTWITLFVSSELGYQSFRVFDLGKLTTVTSISKANTWMSQLTISNLKFWTSIMSIMSKDQNHDYVVNFDYVEGPGVGITGQVALLIIRLTRLRQSNETQNKNTPSTNYNNGNHPMIVPEHSDNYRSAPSSKHRAVQAPEKCYLFSEKKRLGHICWWLKEM